MKKPQIQTLTLSQTEMLAELGVTITRLRLARGIRQVDAAMRSGMSRSTAALIEKGAASVAVGQFIRYLDAIAPNKTLLSLLQEDDPALISLAMKERTQRTRTLSAQQLTELDF